MAWCAFETAWGWCGAARSAAGFSAFVLPVASRRQAQAALGAAASTGCASRRGFKELIEQVARYFDGWTPHLEDLALDLSAGTAFQRRVWTLTRQIPFGHVRSYHWLGLQMGRPSAARAIGAALGANPLALLIPCHRVIAADGRLTGFSAPGGIELKARMLRLERIPVFGQGDDLRVSAR